MRRKRYRSNLVIVERRMVNEYASRGVVEVISDRGSASFQLDG